jgi:heme-degrading monooxygenase HmoA
MANIESAAEDFDENALDLLRQTVRSTPGYVAGFHMLDPKTRKALSVTVFEDRDALQRAREALEALSEERKIGISADEVELYEDTFAF